jgi:hypothetical protein
MIRRLKIAYLLYNLFNRSRLRHNERIYKALNLSKRYFSPISSKDFEGIDGHALMQGTVNKLSETSLFAKLPEEDRNSLLNFERDGFSILRGYVGHQEIDSVNTEIDRMVKSGELRFKNRNKLMFAFRKIEGLRKIATDHDLLELLSSMLADKARLFQSINFITGSEQDTHSDSIHMTTFPLGGLLGVWVALEDIDADNGPLHYYPGSHKLPYYMNRDYDNEGNFFFTGGKSYSEYENMIRSKISEYGLQKKIFTAKAGDLLIWHANLFHGGEKHLNSQKTRKSVVFHYFAENRICYHEITQRPSLMD